MTLSDLVVLVMEVMSRTTHSDMVTGDAEVEMEEEVLQLGVLGTALYSPALVWALDSRSQQICLR